MEDLKDKVVSAKALERLVFDANLSPEAIVLAICAVLRGGSLPRHQAPRLRGSAEYRCGRANLKKHGLAHAPHSMPNVLDLDVEKFANLFPKDVKVEQPKPKPKPKSGRSGSSKAGSAGKDAGAPKRDAAAGKD